MTDHAKPTWDAPPDVAGSRGRGWRFDMAKWKHDRPDTTAALSTWLLNCPRAHPVWEWWIVSVIHLRTIEGYKPATITVKGATHEVMVVSLDPRYEPPDPSTTTSGDAMHYLMPVDVAQQFVAKSDAEAAELCEFLVLACCDGGLSPDQDFRRLWRVAVESNA